MKSSVLAGTAILAFALSFTGQTMAVWQDSVEQVGGRVIAGEMTTVSFTRHCNDVADPENPQPVDMGTFVPNTGDRIECVFEHDTVLRGNHLIADLSYTSGGELLSQPVDGVTAEYTVLNRNRNLAYYPDRTPVASQAGSLPVIHTGSADNPDRGNAYPLGRIAGQMDLVVTVSLTVTDPADWSTVSDYYSNVDAVFVMIR